VLEEDNYKISLEHLVGTNNKDVLKNVGVWVSKRCRNHQEGLRLAKTGIVQALK
jgi:hypothetical protein